MIGARDIVTRVSNRVDCSCDLCAIQPSLPISSGNFLTIVGDANRLPQTGIHGRHRTLSLGVSTFMSGVIRLLGTVTEAVAARHWHPYSTDPEELRYPTKIFIWVRWFIYIASLISLIYRPTFTVFTYASFITFLTLGSALNGAIHYRISSGRTVTLRWLLVLSGLDVVMITLGIVVGGGFNHYFFYLLYYPSLAWFAVFFSSFRVSFAWVTIVAVAYITVSLAAGPGLDFEAKDEKTLFVRIVVMYAVVASVNLVSRAERIRRQAAVVRERELLRERMELSRTIHDTTAQSVYMIGLGIETALELADGENQELASKLEATAALSKSAMWELRHPIDTGLIFEGRQLGLVLRSHAAAFTTIASVPAEVVQTGLEPSLPATTRTMLFAIAHNALTNALRHSGATRVTVALDFEASGLRMSVSDDGVGLPVDYADRGHGFNFMRANAARAGGRLAVESGGPRRGTTVTCAIEYDST